MFVLLAATDGPDPFRSDADDEPYRDDPPLEDPPPETPLPGDPPQSDPPPEEPVIFPEEPPGTPAEPEVTDPDVSEPEISEPAVEEPVALVPSVGEMDMPAAEPEAVREALRGTEAPAADVTAADNPAEPAKRSPVQRFVVALLLIAAAALIGYAVSRPSASDSDPDTLVRSVEAARTLQLVLDTEDPLEARRFVRNEFGWRVGVPVFGEASALSLRGVAVAEVAPAVEVPAFLYSNGANREVAIFVYSYALLDQVPDRLTFAPADFGDLDVGDPVVRRIDGSAMLLWRDRDDIYVAVSDLPPDDLRAGLTMAR